jgi:hypothetical protein
VEAHGKRNPHPFEDQHLLPLLPNPSLPSRSPLLPPPGSCVACRGDACPPSGQYQLLSCILKEDLERYEAEEGPAEGLEREVSMGDLDYLQ